MPIVATLTVAQTLAAFANSTLQAGTRVLDTGANVAASIDALQTVAASGLLQGIDLRNGGRPPILIASAQRLADATALNLISNPHTLDQRITAAQAAGAVLDPNLNALSVWDSAANIAANLPAIEALWRAGMLDIVRLTDSGVPNFQLSAATVAANIDALRNISTAFTITLTDATPPTLTLPVWATALTTYTAVMARIVSPFTLAIAGPLRASALAGIVDGADRYTDTNGAQPANPIAPLGGTSTANLPGGLTVLDYQSRISAFLDSLQIATAAGKVSSIVFRDAGVQVLSLTPAMLTNDAAAVAKLSPNYQLSQVIPAAQAVVGAARDGRFANFTVEDSLANVLANISGINTLIQAGQLGKVRFKEAAPDIKLSAAQLGTAAQVLGFAFENTEVVTLTDAGTPTVTIGAAAFGSFNVRNNVLNNVTGSYSLVVTGPSPASRAAALVSENNKVLASLTAITIVDFASNVASNIGALQTLAAAGKITSITLITAGVPILGLSGAAITADAAALALITTPFIAGSATPVTQTISSATMLGNIVNLETQYRAGTLGSIALTDPGASIAVSAATLAQNLDVFGKISSSYSISLTDSGTPTLALTSAQIFTANLGALSRISSLGGYRFTVSGPVQANAAALLGSNLTGGAQVVDFATNIASNITGLIALQQLGQISSITLSDGGVPRLSIAGSQAAAAAPVLALITTPYALSQVVLAVDAANTTLSGAFVSLSVSDTAANIVTNLPALETLAVNGTLVSINGLVGTINLSAAQVAANAQALLRAGTGYSITLIDVGTPTLTLPNWLVSSDIATLLNRINSPYTLAISGPIRPNRAATLVSAGSTIYNHLAANSLVVRDPPFSAEPFLPQLLTLAQAGKIQSIDTRGGLPDLNLTPAEAVTYAPVLALVNTPYRLTQTITVANIGSTSLSAGFADFTVVDSVANVLAGLSQVQALAAAGQLGDLYFTDAAPRIVTTAAAISASGDVWLAQNQAAYPIVLTDPGTPTITVPAYQIGFFDMRNNVLDAITGSWNLAISGRATIAEAVAIMAENNGVLAHLTGALPVAGIASDLQRDLDYLQALSQAGHLASIDILDTGPAAFTLTSARTIADAQALAAITTPYQLSVNVSLRGAASVVQSVTFVGQTLGLAAQSLSDVVNAGILANTTTAVNIAPGAGGSLPSVPGGQTGALLLQQSDQVTVTAGYKSIFNTATGVSTVFGGGAAGQLVVSGAGGLLFNAGAGTGTVLAAGGNNLISVYPGFGDQRIYTGSGNDTVVLLGGNDYVDAGAGSNQILTGKGADTINSTGNDLIAAGDIGNATITAGANNPVAFFGPGNTVFNAGSGNATVVSTVGKATVNGQGGTQIWLGSNQDVVNSTGADTVIGSVGAASITASGNDFVFAGTGAIDFSNVTGIQTVLGSATGALTLRGGSGGIVALSYGATRYLGGTGAATVAAFGGSVTTSGGAGGGLFLGGPAGNNSITGGALPSILLGGGNGDVLTAGSSAGDVIQAAGGAETISASGTHGTHKLYGGSGADLIQTGLGNANVLVGTGATTIIAGGGIDLYALTKGHGNAVTVQNFGPGNYFTLVGFSIAERDAALAASTTLPGAGGGHASQQLVLSDGTSITLQGFTGLTTASFL